jgi:cell division transport system ATP-binding protein
MIKFEQVSKQFSKNVFGINNVSFNLNKGELVFLTGQSGSGKSTIFKLITKEYNSNNGKIYFNDIEVNKLKKRKIPLLRQKIGVIFQDYRLIPDMSVWENIALPLYIQRKNKSEIKERIRDLLKLVELEKKMFFFPAELSGGEIQKVALARSLTLSPELILADEPTGNLDETNALKISKMLEKINKMGTTIFFITHDLSLMEKIEHHRHIELKDGQIVSNKIINKIEKKTEEIEKTNKKDKKDEK